MRNIPMLNVNIIMIIPRKNLIGVCLDCPNSSFNLTYFYADTMQPLNTTLNYKINASIAINASSNCAFAVNLMLSDNDNVIFFTRWYFTILSVEIGDSSPSNELFYCSYADVLRASLRLYPADQIFC